MWFETIATVKLDQPIPPILKERERGGEMILHSFSLDHLIPDPIERGTEKKKG